MRAATIVFVMTMAFSARAGESVDLWDGAKATLSKGKLEVFSEGNATWTFALPEARDGNAEKLTKYDLADGDVALHARVDIGQGKASEAVVFAKKSRPKGLKVVWKEITGLSGDVGERTGSEVRFEDLTGDGFVEIVEGRTSESVRLCGLKELPLLFRAVYDPKSGAFRPVLAMRPGLGTPVEIKGSLEPGAGPTESLVKQIAPVSASRTAGDRQEVFLLAPPGGLVDGNPATAWIPIPGNGAGEFVTLDMLIKTYGLVRIGIRALPDALKPEKYDRPRTLLLATEKGIFRLVFPSDPLDQPEKTAWFDLPEPAITGCISLIIESSFAPFGNRPVSIAELVALTEIDAEGGLDKLAGDLGKSQTRREAAMLLALAGEKAVLPIRKVFAGLDWQGRQRAVTVLADAAPTQGADLLVEAAMSADPELVEPALRGIRAAGDAAVPPLAEFMARESGNEYEKSVDLLASMGTKSALDALAAGVGRGGRERRVFLRSRIAVAAGRSTELAERLRFHIAQAEESGQTEALLDLLRAAVGNKNLADGISNSANRLWEKSDSFADRFRLLETMSALKCAAPFEHLETAAKDRDHLIRAAAVSALGECSESDPKRANLIVRALGDGTPEVRIAALGVLSRNGPVDGAAETFGRLVGSDPWPEVRALAAAGSRRLPSDIAVSILEKAHADGSSRVRAAAIESAGSISGKRADQIIETSLKDGKELSWIKKIAAEAAEARCQSSAVPALFEVLKEGAEPLADVKRISAGQAAARAMGAIGGPEAFNLLSKAKRRSNPATDKAIAAALAALGEKCGQKK